jgi:hypothetical protein
VRILRWIEHAFTRNVLWKLLSLAIAVLIWMLVESEPQVSTFATARLEYRNLPEDLEISSEPVTSVVLELEGPSGQLGGFGEPAGPNGLRPSVILDMSGVRAGQRTFPIGGEDVRLTRGVRVLRAIPSEVRLEFEPRLDREVPVVVRLAGSPPAGYAVAAAVVDPQTLEIAGPRSHVMRVNEVTTDPIDISAVTSALTVRVNAFVQDPFVRLESSPEVRATVTMKKQ